MPSNVLYFLYLVVMAAGLACFLQAYRMRLSTEVHKRWGITGTAISLGGIGVVLLATYLWGWRVEQRLPDVVLWHRRLALVSVTLLVLTAVTGMRRIPIHTRLYVVFLPVYIAALVTAAVGYRP